MNYIINENIAAGSMIVTDGWKGYNSIEAEQYDHKQCVAKHIQDKNSVLPGVRFFTDLQVIGQHHPTSSGDPLKYFWAGGAVQLPNPQVKLQTLFVWLQTTFPSPLDFA
jgi:hypothetical protein